MARKIRVLAAKPGLDGHDRGIKVLCHALMEAKMEVIYTGLRQTPKQIVNTAIQEDVDVICLSSLSGAHNYLFTEIIKLLQEKKARDILILGGGIIPDGDIPNLKKAGIAEIFGPGASTKQIISFIKENVHIGRF